MLDKLHENSNSNGIAPFEKHPRIGWNRRRQMHPCKRKSDFVDPRTLTYLRKEPNGPSIAQLSLGMPWKYNIVHFAYSTSALDEIRKMLKAMPESIGHESPQDHVQIISNEEPKDADGMQNKIFRFVYTSRHTEEQEGNYCQRKKQKAHPTPPFLVAGMLCLILFVRKFSFVDTRHSHRLVIRN